MTFSLNIEITPLNCHFNLRDNKSVHFSASKSDSTFARHNHHHHHSSSFIPFEQRTAQVISVVAETFPDRFLSYPTNAHL